MCATLVFTTAITGNLASYLVNIGDHQWVYDFHKGTCTFCNFCIVQENSAVFTIFLHVCNYVGEAI